MENEHVLKEEHRMRHFLRELQRPQTFDNRIQKYKVRNVFPLSLTVRRAAAQKKNADRACKEVAKNQSFESFRKI